MLLSTLPVFLYCIFTTIIISFVSDITVVIFHWFGQNLCSDIHVNNIMSGVLSAIQSFISSSILLDLSISPIQPPSPSPSFNSQSFLEHSIDPIIFCTYLHPVHPPSHFIYSFLLYSFIFHSSFLLSSVQFSVIPSIQFFSIVQFTYSSSIVPSTSYFSTPSSHPSKPSPSSHLCTPLSSPHPSTTPP